MGKVGEMHILIENMCGLPFPFIFGILIMIEYKRICLFPGGLSEYWSGNKGVYSY